MSKKYIFGFVIIVLLLLTVAGLDYFKVWDAPFIELGVFDNDYPPAWPQFGSVCCDTTKEWSEITRDMEPISGEDVVLYSYTCTNPTCKIETPNIVCQKFLGDTPPQYHALKVNNVCRGTTSNNNHFRDQACTQGDLDFPEEVFSGDYVQIYSVCQNWQLGDDLPESATVNIRLQEIQLYYWFNGATINVPRSEGCARQDIIDNYLDAQPRSSLSTFMNSVKNYIQDFILEDETEEKNKLQDLPTQIGVGDCYLFLYRWEEVPSINMIPYDKDGDGEADSAVMCDIYSKKVREWESVETYAGNYNIPTNEINLGYRQYPCCVPEDCINLGAKWTCDINTFNCVDTETDTEFEGNPCNSPYDCGAEFVSGELCQNIGGELTLTTWGCDQSYPQPGWKGTCTVAEEREVECCKDSCAGDEWCDYDEGCKKQSTQISCGAGYCCKAGYEFTEQLCTDNKQCCFDIGSDYRGLCRDTCQNVCDYDGDCDIDKGETKENCPSDCSCIKAGKVKLEGISCCSGLLERKSDETVYCVEPKKKDGEFNWGWVIIPTITLLFSSIGAVLKKSKRGKIDWGWVIVFTIIGLLVSLAVFSAYTWYTKTPWYIKLLQGAGVFGAGIGLLYILMISGVGSFLLFIITYLSKVKKK